MAVGVLVVGVTVVVGVTALVDGCCFTDDCTASDCKCQGVKVRVGVGFRVTGLRLGVRDYSSTTTGVLGYCSDLGLWFWVRARARAGVRFQRL